MNTVTGKFRTLHEIPNDDVHTAYIQSRTSYAHVFKLMITTLPLTYPRAAVGVRITGVDNDTYSLTGEAYSHIVGPNSSSTASKVLQEDDIALGAWPSSNVVDVTYASPCHGAVVDYMHLLDCLSLVISIRVQSQSRPTLSKDRTPNWNKTSKQKTRFLLEL
jgi:hypothetical protein